MTTITYDLDDDFTELKHVFILLSCLLFLGVHLFLFTPSSEFLIGDWMIWIFGLCVSIIASVVTIYDFIIKRFLNLKNTMERKN